MNNTYPLIITEEYWANSQLSVARFYAGIHYMGHQYLIVNKEGKDLFELSIEADKAGRDKAMPATKEQCDLLFQKIKEAGYEWDAEKKELRKIKPHYDIANFKPKQWVLVRNCDNQVWGLSMFSHRDMGCYICINRVDFTQCIPFEGNEKLLGTTDPCPKEYINW